MWIVFSWLLGFLAFFIPFLPVWHDIQGVWERMSRCIALVRWSQGGRSAMHWGSYVELLLCTACRTNLSNPIRATQQATKLSGCKGDAKEMLVEGIALVHFYRHEMMMSCKVRSRSCKPRMAKGCAKKKGRHCPSLIRTQ